MHKIYTDGGSRGNPGNAAAAFYLFDEEDKILDFGGEYLGIQTNNYAEYQGLKLGLKAALKNLFWDLNCYLDSELVVKQLNGEYKVRDAVMLKEFTEVKELAQKFETITFNHVRREQNKLADKLVNIILDNAAGK